MVDVCLKVVVSWFYIIILDKYRTNLVLDYCKRSEAVVSH